MGERSSRGMMISSFSFSFSFFSFFDFLGDCVLFGSMTCVLVEIWMSERVLGVMRPSGMSICTRGTKATRSRSCGRPRSYPLTTQVLTARSHTLPARNHARETKGTANTSCKGTALVEALHHLILPFTADIWPDKSARSFPKERSSGRTRGLCDADRATGPELPRGRSH